MNGYILTYNITHPDHNYSPLFDVLKGKYPNNFHLTETSWIIFTEDSAADIAKSIHDKFVYDRLADSYVVFKLAEGKDYCGFTVKSFWLFLKDNLGTVFAREETENN